MLDTAGYPDELAAVGRDFQAFLTTLLYYLFWAIFVAIQSITWTLAEAFQDANEDLTAQDTDSAAHVSPAHASATDDHAADNHAADDPIAHKPTASQPVIS